MPSTLWMVICNRYLTISLSSFSLSIVSCTLFYSSLSICGVSSWKPFFSYILDHTHVHILIRLPDPWFWYDNWSFPREIHQWTSSSYFTPSILHGELRTSKPSSSRFFMVLTPYPSTLRGLIVLGDHIVTQILHWTLWWMWSRWRTNEKKI